ncbi:hypothetical protein [Bradymonas sediminis]|uniref:Uncharacterized protein n=1 Tax=Bradymonas sediminis TaxID=1548548 RepID=A0A2Z4FKI1_9DELT|nr:hypothetical protein [Bradymonas sediminis]AWV89295.1 hypothetical protein DN745_08070 [Bradymonas sediminis]TDP73468.1 hypothetical protein DFR33_106108 [Bradymonas sediminis]
MIAHNKFRFRPMLVAIIVTLFCGYTAGCSDDSTGKDGDNNRCGPDEVFNPLQGCVSSRVDPRDDAGVDDTQNADVFVPPDVVYDPDANTEVDVSDDERCSPELDSDGDGLSNECECRLGTDPGNSDTDGDGVPDGVEDANQNCVYDVGVESNPREADTDHDGLDDGQERMNGTDFLNPDTDGDGVYDGAEVASGCMNPRVADTDGDGIPDGVEDANKDGMLGVCVDRVYSAECAQGESDPCSADTDGDGVPDGEEAAYLDCSAAQTDALVAPQLVVNSTGNYQLALPLGVAVAQATALTTGSAHAFNDVPNKYAGFVGSWTTSTSVETALRDEVFNKIRGMYPGSTLRDEGQRTTTHDNHPAVVQAQVELHGITDLSQARDEIMAKLAGGVASHSLSGTFPAATTPNPLIFTFEVIRRGVSAYVVSGAVARQSELVDNAMSTGFLISDITGGSAVAEAGETLVEQCVSYKVSSRPQVDFIWIIDSSGSMSDEIRQVRQFADSFVAILQASDVDWRLAVTSGTCDAIADDPAVSPDAKAFLGGSGMGQGCPSEMPDLPFPMPVPISFTPYKNGKLCDLNGANFTRDPQKFKDCVDNIANDESLEFTMSIAVPTIDRALPRMDDNPLKLRPDAAVVVISVTDEFDEYVQNQMGWTDTGNGGSGGGNDPTLDPNFDSAQLDLVLAPIVGYLDRPNVDATLFGIHWIAGEACSSASEAAAGIGRVAEATGGSSGSVCAANLDGTLTDIANAAVGLSSGIRLRGTPAPPSIAPKIGEVNSGQIIEATRSRADGWDYDSLVNRVLFDGPTPLRDQDRVVVPYLRWDGSLDECRSDADCPRGMKLTCIDNMCR